MCPARFIARLGVDCTERRVFCAHRVYLCAETGKKCALQPYLCAEALFDPRGCRKSITEKDCRGFLDSRGY